MTDLAREVLVERRTHALVADQLLETAYDRCRRP